MQNQDNSSYHSDLLKLKIEKKQIDLDKKKSGDFISRLLNDLAQENYKLQSLDRNGEEV